MQKKRLKNNWIVLVNSKGGSNMITKKIIRALYERFVTIYGKRFTHDFEGHDNRLIMWIEDWYEGLLGIDPKTFKDAIHFMMTTLKWPPTLPEFRELCERSDGFPNEREILISGSSRNFHHPLIKIVYDKVGSWEFHNSSADKVSKLISVYYLESLANLRKNLYEECKNKLIDVDLKLVNQDKEVEDGRRNQEDNKLRFGNLLSVERDISKR